MLEPEFLVHTSPAYRQRIRATLADLGIAPEWIERRRLPVWPEAQDLVVAETDPAGREYRLTPQTTAAWRRLRDAATAAGIDLQIVSAFRSFERQAEIIRRKLERGLSLDAILAVSAPPGYSEHHTGQAVDIGTAGDPPLEASFEHTAAFTWLQWRAEDFGFRLSFPRNNPSGYCFEPWHWAHGLDPAPPIPAATRSVP